MKKDKELEIVFELRNSLIILYPETENSEKILSQMSY